MTVTAGTGLGYLTVYPGTASKPNASTVNWTAGETTSDSVVVPLGSDGTVRFTNTSAGTVHIVADLYGYYSG